VGLSFILALGHSACIQPVNVDRHDNFTSAALLHEWNCARRDGNWRFVRDVTATGDL